MTNCEVCGCTEPVGVASVPGIPYSAAYCEICLKAGADPVWLLIANVSSFAYSKEHVAEWARDQIDRTLAHLNIEEKWFWDEVFYNAMRFDLELQNWSEQEDEEKEKVGNIPEFFNKEA